MELATGEQNLFVITIMSLDYIQGKFAAGSKFTKSQKKMHEIKKNEKEFKNLF